MAPRVTAPIAAHSLNRTAGNPYGRLLMSTPYYRCAATDFCDRFSEEESSTSWNWNLHPQVRHLRMSGRCITKN